MAQAGDAAGRAAAREARHRRRAAARKRPATRRARPRGRRCTSSSRSSGFVLGRLAIVLVARIGEGFLRDLRNRLFGHLMSAVARLLRDREDRQDRRAHDLRHRRDAGARLAGPRAVRAEHRSSSSARSSSCSSCSWQLALGVLVIVPPVYFASRWFRRVSNKAYLEVRDSIATNLSTLQEGLEGVRVVQAFGREDVVHASGSRRTNEDQYDANMDDGSHLVEVLPDHRVRGRRRHRGDHRLRRLARRRAASSRSARSPRSCCTCNSLFEPIKQLSQLYNTVQSAAAALAQDLRRARHAARRSASARPRSTCPRSGAVEVDHVTFAYGAERAGAARRVAAHRRRASGSRSSARPARASRRSPS